MRVIGFYDMRGRCPNNSAILPQHRGKAGVCIGLTLQAYRDAGGKARAVGRDVLAPHHLWDPYQPGQTRGGISQLACEDPEPTCSNIFLGDYFSMQVSASRVVRAVDLDVPALARARGRRGPDPLPAAGPDDGLAARAG